MNLKETLKHYVGPFEAIETLWMYGGAVALFVLYGITRFLAGRTHSTFVGGLVAIALLAFVVTLHLATTVAYARLDPRASPAIRWTYLGLFIGAGLLLFFTAVMLSIVGLMHMRGG